MEQGEFKFDGSGWGVIGIAFGSIVATLLTLTLALPWIYVWQLQWFTDHITIDGRRLCFTGSGWGYFGTSLLIGLLTLITFGLYTPWGVVRFWKWAISNTHFAEQG